MSRNQGMCDDFGGVVDDVYLVQKLTFISASNLGVKSVNVWVL